MEFDDKSIVLRVGTFREADLWVRLLSPSRGIFSAFAFGGSKSRRRFSGCLDLFNEVLFHVKSTHQGEYMCLQEGVLLKGTDRLRRDWRRMGVAVNCALFAEALCLNPEGAAQTHSLFAELLHTLETWVELPQLLPIFFRARLAFEQGYALNPYQCILCGALWEDKGAAVLPVHGSGLVCRSCAPEFGYRFALGLESILVLRHIFSAPLRNWLDMPGDGAAQKECARAVDGFLQYNTGLYWEHGRFRKG